MQKKTKMVVGIVVVAVIVVTALAAVIMLGNGSGQQVQTLKISGSTTVLPIGQAAAEAFMNSHSNVDVQVSGGGSGVGITAVGQGTVDIGMSSRDLTSTDTSQYPNLKPTTIARDGIAIIVNTGNALTNITIDQVRGIYNGTYTNWKDLGGSDMAITVINRDSASGTRDFFSSFVMKKQNFTKAAIEKNSNEGVKDTVKQTPGAIGYVGLGYIDTSVKALKIHYNGQDIPPSVATVLDKSYPISRNLYMITNGDAKELAKEFIDFVLSADGQNIVQQQGFVPIK